MESRKAVFAVIGAGILWGVISLFIRPLSAAGLDPMQIASVRMVTASVLFLCVIAVRSPGKLRVRVRDLWMFAGTGIVSVSLFNFCYFYTIIHSEASVAVVLLYTSPVFILLLSAILFRERITRRKVFALLLTFAGCVCVAGLTGGVRLSAVVFLTGIGSGLFYGLYTIFGRYALAKYDAVTVTAYSFLFALAGSLPFGRPAALVRTITAEPRLLLLCAGIGLCSTVLPYYLYTWGLERMESGKAAILVAVEPLVACLLGIFAYGEGHDFPKILGIVFVLGAILLLNAPKKKTSL